ncbi:helix-turn-helix transcriptional regulator [Priestia megaterium]|uniref:helix-turn-helix domain-containing protein n=1 Tax=Priestia megaterium TaxID=1404 RepID=UPI002E1B970F|nr:helix-turn-helix transcriptional regulator [Priestia megaterium]
MHSDTYTEFGKRLKALRKTRKMTQEELADEMGISKTSVVNYEGGTRKVPLELIIKFAEYFNVSMDDLMGINVTNQDREHMIFSNNPRMIEATNRWYTEVGVVDFTSKELDELIHFAKYLVWKRNEE